MTDLSTLEEKVDQLIERFDSLERRLDCRPLRESDNYLTVEEAVKEFKLSKSTVYRMKNAQVKIGGALRISRELLQREVERPGRLV